MYNNKTINGGCGGVLSNTLITTTPQRNGTPQTGTTPTNRNHHHQHLLNEPLQLSDEWCIEDLESDQGQSDKELVSPPAKVVNKAPLTTYAKANGTATEEVTNRDRMTQSERDAAAEQADQSEYSSLDDEEEDDEDFNDDTAGANDESLEEDVLDAMTAEDNRSAVTNSSDSSSLLTVNGTGNSKVTMKQLHGTVSGCVMGGRQTTAPFSKSLFPNVPLYFSFATHTEVGPTVPPCISKIMKWKLTPVTPVVVRKVLVNTGFRLLKRK